MSTRPPAIRRATAGDAAALAAFAARAFVDAYGLRNDPADVAQHVARTYSTERQSEELATAGVHCLLALEDAAIVGYALLGEGSGHEAVPARSPCEIRRFYVDGSRHGQGVASALMEAAAGEARAAGCCTLWLTTWEHSLRARGFYAKSGFVDVGATTFLLGSSLQTDRLLVRRLG
jgi:GNAT superfamily N-acetyltransferase